MSRKEHLLTAGIIVMLTACGVVGCGEEKTVDYTIEGVTEEQAEGQTAEKAEGQDAESVSDKQPQNAGGKIGLAQFEGEEEWKNTLRTKLVTESGNGEQSEVYADVRVKAEIIVPQVNQMSVVEVTETQFDAAYKENLAKKIFPSEELYYGNVANLPRQDIERLWPKYEASITITSEEPFNFEEWNNERIACYEAYNNLDNLKDTYTPVKEFSVNRYLGNYEGRMYSLTFLEDEEDREYVYRRMKRITLEANDIYEVCPDKFKKQQNLSCMPWMFGDWLENPCEISEEEALKEAENFVDKLGFDTLVYTFSRPLAWGNVPEVIAVMDTGEAVDWGVNGYVFYFDLGVDDISFVQYGVEEDYFNWETSNAEDEDGEKVYSLRSQLQIYVTDKGIIKMVLDNPVDITGVSGGLELLPLDTVKEIIRKELDAQWQVFRFGTYYPLDMNEMELIYFRVRDKDNPGKFSYVPTWRLGTVMREEVNHGIDIRYPVLINAIDGSVIDFYDET